LILSKPNYIKIYGHRGARGDMPENTLSGFKYIFDSNVLAFETDILISKDKIPVITHDFYLNPDLTKDINGNWIKKNNIKIYDLKYEELKKYEVGELNKSTRYGKRFNDQKSVDNQKIIKLEELFELVEKFPKEDFFINLEIKSTPLEEGLTPNPKEMVSIVKKEILKSKYLDKILISSFDWRILSECKKQLPDTLRGYLSFQQDLGSSKKTIYEGSPWMNTDEEFNMFELPKLIKKLEGHVWCAFHRDITKQNVSLAHDLGLGVNVWTVNSERDMIKMIKYGVDGIITDYPNRLKKVCDTNNVKWF
jgi:glycerophosphoryl diester phosphodiesterase